MSVHYIFWSEKTSGVFLAGSTIQILPNHRVIFKNERMAPSFVIHEWRSKYNFQGSRRVAVLPNLNVGETYRIKLNATIIPENTIHIKLTFYNQFNEKIDYMISTKEEFEVVIPENTYEYEIQLINAGCHTVDFFNIEISLASTSSIKHPFYSWVNVDEQDSTATVLFVESNLYFPEVPMDEVEGLSNVFIVPCNKDNQLDVLSSDMHVLIKSQLNTLQQQKTLTSVRFVGYGAISNFMALAHAKFFEKSTCHITDLLLPEERYCQLFGNQLSIFKDVATVLNRRNQPYVSTLYISNDKPELFRLQSFLSLRSILLEMQLILKD